MERHSTLCQSSSTLLMTESPKAFPPGTRALQTAFLSAFVPKTSPIWPVILPAVAGKFGPTSMEAFKEKREAQFGKTIEEMARDISTREINWAKFKKGMSDIDRWMKSNEDDVGGPFMMGEKPVFVDFVIGALLAWIRNVWGEESTEWTEMKTWDDHRWAKHADALKPYESADDGLKPCHANDSSNLLGSDTASDAKKLLL
ncbi:hypothetical protein BKA70DRAFT_1323953 [Coprinopsis sp. MPI-PUGE-AT-0042]|nr:hypothetical protein BKA70DRAFT_1323953 [Coprinopsis sp. MPI-PUGE-AT-0042]